jgi:hypothetical protein
MDDNLRQDAMYVRMELARVLRPDRTTLIMLKEHSRRQIARLAAAWEGQSERSEAVDRALLAARAIRSVSPSQPVLARHLRALHEALVTLDA